jgi:hypothetical protein
MSFLTVSRFIEAYDYFVENHRTRLVIFSPTHCGNMSRTKVDISLVNQAPRLGLLMEALSLLGS